MKPACLLWLTASACFAQSGACAEAQPAPLDAIPLAAGPLTLNIVISKTAQLFHTVDQISQWSEFSHSQYLRYFQTLDGGLSAEDQKLLSEHAEIRKKYGWGRGPEQAFYTSLDLDQALERAVANGYLTDSEAQTERGVLTHFRPRVDRMIAEGPAAINFVRSLQQRQAELAEFATSVARFTGAFPAKPIPFYVIADPDDTNMGGGYNGGCLTLEIPRVRDPYSTILHELFHAFMATKRAQIQDAIRGVPGLDFETFNEGLAYAVSPGIYHASDSDELLAQVNRYVARRSPLSDSYTRFNFFALALRPLLKAALADPKQNLETFLPRAADAWRVLAELDATRVR